MATGDLTTLATAKSWLGITNTNEDDLLARLVTAASQFIQTWLNRDLLVQSYSEIRDGHGGQTLVFRDYPVVSVSSVQVGGYTIPAAGSVLESGYWFTPTLITLRGYRFDKGIANVVLSYQAGFASTPPEIEQACLELMGIKYRERDRIGHSSKSLAGETVAFIVKDLPDPVRAILNNYRKVIPV